MLWPTAKLTSMIGSDTGITAVIHAQVICTNDPCTVPGCPVHDQKDTQ
jgi:hypothetical protein